MTERWQHRLNELNEIKATPDVFERARYGRRVYTRKRPRRYGWLAAAGAATLVASAVAAWGTLSSSAGTGDRHVRATEIGESTASPLSLADEPATLGAQGKNPFVGAREMSLYQAQDIVGFDIPRPDDPLASDDQIAHVWVSTAANVPRIEIDYTSGLYVDVGPANPGMTDAAVARQRYEQVAAEEAAQDGGRGQVITIDGTPAYLVPDGAVEFANGASQGGPGMVEFVVGNHTVEVVGHFSNTDLVRVASSVSARPST